MAKKTETPAADDNTSETYPHQDLITENKVNTANLPEKTQKAIAAFATETDETKKLALDHTIFQQIDEYLEKQVMEEKNKKTTEKINNLKKAKADKAAEGAKTGTAKLDVSKADTAKTTEELEAEKVAAAANAPAKGRSPLNVILGRR